MSHGFRCLQLPADSLGGSGHQGSLHRLGSSEHPHLEFRAMGIQGEAGMRAPSGPPVARRVDAEVEIDSCQAGVSVIVQL